MDINQRILRKRQIVSSASLRYNRALPVKEIPPARLGGMLIMLSKI